MQDAVDWLHAHPQVSKDGIGLVGVSKGAELAIHMAILSPKVYVIPVHPKSVLPNLYGLFGTIFA